jgi:20S proteasome alpha/beta subunit
VGKWSVVGCSGDLADLQELASVLADLEKDNDEWADGHEIKPKSIHSFLTRLFYNKCESNSLASSHTTC